MGRPKIRDEEYWKEYHRNYYLKNKEKWAEYHKKHYEPREKSDPEYRERRNVERALWRDRRRQESLAHLGGCCVKCGMADQRALQIDHVQGGGSKELRSEDFKYSDYFKRLLSEPPGTTYQLLCANCNWIKRHENDEIVGVPRIKRTG